MPRRIELTMYYQEFLPTSVLRPFVRCYWHMAADGELPARITDRILPDGCIDILYNLSDSLRRLGFEEELGQSTHVIGAMRKPALVRFGQNLEIIGIRFQPGGAYPFLRAPLHEITDQAVPIHDLSRNSKLAIDAQLAETRDVLSRIDRVEKLLLSRLGSLGCSDETLAYVISHILRQGGHVSVAALQQWTGISTRQLQRRFKTRTGLTPKSFCRIVRFRAALAILKRQPTQNWADFACRAGFYDQAHLIREFRSLAGLTPTAYLHERANVAFVQDSPLSAR